MNVCDVGVVSFVADVVDLGRAEVRRHVESQGHPRKNRNELGAANCELEIAMDAAKLIRVAIFFCNIAIK